MALTLTPSPFQQVLVDGEPQSGAKIYTYVAGTTTNQSTYTTSAGDVANANPIVADAQGRYVAYLSAGASYKFKITTSADVAIDTQDNVGAVPGASVNLDVLGTVGEAVTAGQVVYISDGSGSKTAGLWYLTDADNDYSSSTAAEIGIVPSAIAINTEGTIRLAGRITTASSVVVGTLYYVSATAGGLTSSAPTNVRTVGIADTTSTLILNANTAVTGIPVPITQDLLFTDNTYDIGKSGATRPRDLFQSRNATIGGTLAVTGVATLTAQPILSSLTASQAVFSDGSKGLASNAITGSGNVVMSASPTLTGTIGAAAMTLSTPLPVASGGTGIAAITANTLMLGAGTSDVTLLAPGTSGNVVTSNGTVWASTAMTHHAYGGSTVSGRLTLTSDTPVTTADVTGAGTIYWTPFNGAIIDLYTGSAWTQVTFAEMSIAASGGTASKPHDLFLDYNGGSPALALLAWTNDTTRATALALQDSILVKTGDTQQRYLGTVWLDGSNQVADSYAKRHVWNYYNRVTRPMRVLDATNSWTYTTATWRQAGANTANQVDLVCGVAQDGIEVSIFAHCNNSSGNVQMSVAVGENSTSAVATGALIGRLDETNTSSIEPVQTTLRALPAAGRNYYVWLEYSQAAGTTTWYGDGGASNIRSGLVAMWWG